MANVVRFALSTAKTLYVPGAGTFIDGILDVDANNLRLLTKTRYLVQPYRAVELGTVDASTPKPSLPAVPGPPAPDPYPQYLTAAEAASSPELRAALVPRPTGGTDGQALVKSGTEVTWGAAGLTPAQIVADSTVRGAFTAQGRGVPGRRLAMLGDSITAGIIGQATPNANNVLQGSALMYGCMAALGRLEFGGLFGVPGDTTAQILARVGQVVTAAPDACLVLGGTNDGALGTIKTNLPQIVTALRAAGIEPILATLPPSSSTNALTNGPHNFIRQANGWITAYAEANALRLVDFFGALVDPATGKYKTGHNSDITHPNQKGYRAMGEALAAALASQVKAGSTYLVQSLSDDTSYMGDGLFTTGTTAPGGWYVAAGAGGAHVTDAFFLGRGFQIARAAADTTTRVVQKDIGAAAWTFQPGDRVVMSCKIKTTGLEASGGIVTISVPNNSRTSGATNMVSYQIGADFPNGAVCSFASVIPPGTNGASVQARIDGGSNAAGDSFTIGQFAVRSLNVLGYP